jgi:hypothetical protein
VQAVDTLFVKAHAGDGGVPANTATWITLRLGNGVPPAEVIGALGPFVNGYALMVAYEEPATVSASRIVFARDQTLQSPLDERAGSFLFQVNLLSDTTAPIAAAQENLRPASYAIDANDATATFSNIALEGDFFNSMRGDIGGMFGPPSPRNLGLTFDNATIVGTISASTAAHILPHIEYPIGWDGMAPFINVGHTEDYKFLGEVTNAPGPAVNNGVLVVLANGSNWTVTGTSYLTSLDVAADAAVTAPAGHTLTMTVDGVPTDIVPGNIYTGAIVLTVN